MAEVSLQNFTDELSPENEEFVKQMFEAGLQWGRKRSVTHPKMRPFIFTTKGDIEVVDLAKTSGAFREAMGFVREIVEKGGIILMVGTQPSAKSVVKDIAERVGFPYVHERWLGGTVTNIKTILDRIEYWRELEDKIRSPEFAEYTKKERQDFQKKSRELAEKFGGLKPMTKLPDAIFIVGTSRHPTALREARRKDIPVIAIVDTDDDPSQVSHPIPANDNTMSGIKLLLNKFAETVEKARTETKKEAETKQAEDEVSAKTVPE